ncbi:uncharacterized protein isoform X1 [Choristoneura fumiferana]|uniref:uncharacterized protein isoform X1 n=1 Tax=Choristoneura fumiferana TaxID=7141 RepID=UPI003D15DE21
MLVSKAVQFLLALAMMSEPGDAATTSAVKLCGRKLSDIMSRVCHAYNSPSWDDPTVVEQPGSVVRRKRQIGIADQCCTFGCTWEQLNEYCAISANSESALDDEDTHIVAEHTGSERKREAVPAPAPVVRADTERSREVGRGRSRGYGRRRGRRCWCRRKRRSGRRRSSVMGNMDQKNVRPAAVVGTVSPLLIWGSTLNADLPPDNNRYNYIAVYS